MVSRRGAAALDPRKLPMNLRHRGLFIAYAPANAPTIAIAVAIEGGGYGADSAAPIARKVFDAWLLGKMPGTDAQAGDTVHFDNVSGAVDGVATPTPGAAP